ncbi:MAG: VTT domain-containing protein [Desulfobacterales bacterium]
MTRNRIIAALAAAAVVALALWLAADPGLRAALAEFFARIMDRITDREWVRARVQSAGWAAPLVFIGLQIAQVIAAPVPGEATGFIGGYIFGAAQGFLFSSVGLTLGSLVNFGIGRALGRRYVRKLIPEKSFERLDRLINRQGVLVVFLMLLIPGFPKDYLCLLLGLSTLPPKLFLLLASIGRMPGTLLLSVKGAALYDQDYLLLGIVAAAALVLVLLAVFFRERLYRWLETFNT